MRPVGISKGNTVTAAVLGALLLTLTAAPARAGSFTFDSGTNTYTYLGDLFNFCGFGCPENAPSDPLGVDFITATLLYGAKLAPNLTDASPVPISWTMEWDAGVLVPAQVPEPATLMLVGGGLLAVARRRLRARRG
jgi:PEP-CTERM motif